MKKSLAILFVLCSIVGMSYAQEIVVAPGAMLSLYSSSLTGMPAPGTEALDVTVDKSEEFSTSVLSEVPELQPHQHKNRILAWEGYLNIPADGEYVFAGTAIDNAMVTCFLADAKLFSVVDDGKRDLILARQKALKKEAPGEKRMEIDPLEKEFSEMKSSESRALVLKQGDYLVRIYMARTHSSASGSFTLKFWNKQAPLKKVVVAPANLFHAE